MGEIVQWIRANRLLTAGVAAAVVGLVLLVAGVMTAPATPAFGWFAYAPLANPPTLPGPTAGQIFGASLGGVGLVLVAGALGYYAARRRG